MRDLMFLLCGQFPFFITVYYLIFDLERRIEISLQSYTRLLEVLMEFTFFGSE